METAKDRRRAPRFKPPVRIELQSLDGAKSSQKSSEKFAPLRDVSLKGFSFFSSESYEVGARLQFVVRHPFRLEKKSKLGKKLLAGVARIVRCEKVANVDHFPYYAVSAEMQSRARKKPKSRKRRVRTRRR